ncbi:MAG: S41 family peptidase [Acidobacteriales bacterium]|nr:S41 family peptidase [Terriglobales bacterium]
MQRRVVAFLVFLAVISGPLCGLASAQTAQESESATFHRALDEFKTALDERWSYRHANGANFDAAIAALHKKINAGISTDDFGLELQKIIALGIDGHARVTGYKLPTDGYLPFLLDADSEPVVAFNTERTAFLAEGFPYVDKIDGKDIKEWCAAAAVLIPKGSPQYVRRHCLVRLCELDYVRGQLKLPRKQTVEVTLASKDGRSRKKLTLPVAASSPKNSPWPPPGSRVLPGGIGYLRLPDLDAERSVQAIKRWMPEFRETAGLIVDVRDNTGGERHALRLLHSYLAAPSDPPRVVNVAAYRLHQAHKENHLAENHFMYRAAAKEWTDEERRAIAEFAKTFKPQWELPKGQFSDWHYLIVRRVYEPDIYHYRQPVVVLMNGKCFSATDIFLAGFKGMKNVTLLGTPSSGGSAYTQDVDLGATSLKVRIGSMASFQADGKLFDGNGVQPDVVVEATPEYYIGGPDNVLAEAVKRITSK